MKSRALKIVYRRRKIRFEDEEEEQKKFGLIHLSAFIDFLRNLKNSIRDMFKVNHNIQNVQFENKLPKSEVELTKLRSLPKKDTKDIKKDIKAETLFLHNKQTPPTRRRKNI
jgi:hypothetical protein